MTEMNPTDTCPSTSTRPRQRRAWRRRVLAALALLVAALAGSVRGQGGEARPRVDVPLLDAAPALADFLDMRPSGAVAGRMAKVEGFVQQEPRDGEPSSQATEVYLGYDVQHLYLAFIAFDLEPDKIRARMSRRENVWNDDTVEVMLDTFNDKRRAYVFLTNPLGIQWDAIWSEGEEFDDSFDTLWHSEGQLTDRGYVVLFRIPFRSLRFPKTPEQQWGLIFNRAIPRTNENNFWPHVSSRYEGRLSQAATMTGLKGISPGRNIQFIPYGVFRSWRSLEPDAPGGPGFVTDRADPDAGLDAKLVLKDSLVLDVAVNPDFSQVESDSPQVTVNQRYEVYFPEKRPFFIENSDYFETPIDLVFTRRIADPQFGLRLTGKAGPYAIGALWADDQAPGEVLPESDPHSGDRAQVGIVRVRRDLLEQSWLGAIYTQRSFGDGFNRVGAVDGRFKLDANWVLSFQAATSQTRGQDGVRSGGPAYEVELDRDGRSFASSTEYVDRSTGFDTEVGYNRRSDIRSLGQWLRYRFFPEGGTLLNWDTEFWAEGVWDHEGTRLDWVANPAISWNLVGETRFGAGLSLNHERLRPIDFPTLPVNRDFATHTSSLFFRSSYFRQLTLEASVAFGTGINFVPPEGQAPHVAGRTAGNFTLSLLPLTALRIDNTYLFSRLIDRESGAAIFNNHILRTKWNYQISREMSLRFILQYDTTLASPELTSLETGKRWNADVLFTYLWHPGTALYVGYNHNNRNLRLADGPNGPEILPTRDDFLNDARVFFVKFSYLIRL